MGHHNLSANRHLHPVWRNRVLTGVGCAVVCLVVSDVVLCQENAAARQSAGGELSLNEFEIWSRFRPRIEFHQQIGESVGLQDNLTRLGAFVPFSGTQSDWLIFADLQGLFTSDQTIGGNSGLGIRRADPDSGIVLGLHCYYDFRDTGINEFQQISPGVEVFGPGWEWRANGYLPRAFESRKAAPDMFSGNFLLIDRFESALSGFDTEFGIYLPDAGPLQPRVYAGAYHFQAPHRSKVWGWSGRLEADVSNAVRLGLSVQNDRLFETTVNFGVTVRFSGGALLTDNPLRGLVDGFTTRPGTRDTSVQLASSPRRQPSIVLDQSEQSVAVDPATGQPLMFIHVAAGGNSTGAFNDPYATLTDALNDPRYLSGEITSIYVQSGSVPVITHADHLVLMDGARILSSGPVQSLMTQSGARRLPGSGQDEDLAMLPIITGDVTMANDSQLSGFEIQAVSTGVSVFRINDVTVSQNVISGAAQSGILVQSNSATPIDNISVMNNRIEGSALSGLMIRSTDNAPISLTGLMIAGNQISDSQRHGLEVDDVMVSGMIEENRLSTNVLDGVNFDDVTFAGDIVNNTIDQNGAAGVNIERSEDFTGRISGNTIAGNFQGSLTPAEFSRLFDVDPTTGVITAKDPSTRGETGIRLRGDFSDITVSDNSVRNFLFAGISGSVTDGDQFTAAFDDNVIDSSVIGIEVLASFNSGTAGLDIRRNTVSNGSSGIVVRNGSFSRSPLFTGDVVANMASGMDFDGIKLRLISRIGDIADNVTNSNGRSGIEFVSFDNFTGHVAGNLSNGNGLKGLSVDVRGLFLGDIRDNTANGSGVKSIASHVGLFVNADNLTGNVQGNVANSNGTIGMEVRVQNQFVGDYSGNTANDNVIRGMELHLPFGSMNGDFFGNSADDNGDGDFLEGIGLFAKGAGILVNGSSGSEIVLTGDMRDNSAMRNLGPGIDVHDMSLIGNLQNNTAGSNGEQGISFESSDRFVGDVTGNVTNSNMRAGIELDLGGQMQGDIHNNTANDNRRLFFDGAGILIDGDNDAELTGSIFANTTLRNETHGIRVHTVDVTGNVEGNTSNLNGTGIAVTRFDQFIGNIADNVLNNNVDRGLDVDVRGLMQGDIRDNTANDTTSGAGIFVSGSGSAMLIGNVSDNMTLRNSAEGLLVQRLGLVGNVEDNVADSNDLGVSLGGLFTRLTKFDGAFLRYFARNNQLEGLFLTVGLNQATSLLVQDNEFSGNNGGSREVRLVNFGAADLNLTLQDNSSLNSAGSFGNYLLQNLGSGNFNVSPSNVVDVNEGTIIFGTGVSIVP